ncbi:MAG: DUF4390 domain-containing protein [Leptothrix ochracea]
MVGFVLCVWIGLTLGLLGAPAPAQARSEAIELQHIEAHRQDGNLDVSFDTRFELAPSVEEALQKGVSLYFVAEAEVQLSRWYWFDRTLLKARRVWRLSYQPLTMNYRVHLGGLSQTYATLAEALKTLQRSKNWRLNEPPMLVDEGPLNIEFSYRLDATQLPRPLQLSIGAQREWHLHVQRSLDVGPSPH